MNDKTKNALKDFIVAVQDLTAAVYVQIGQDCASEIMDRCENLKTALDKDETIL